MVYYKTGTLNGLDCDFVLFVAIGNAMTEQAIEKLLSRARFIKGSKSELILGSMMVV